MRRFAVVCVGVLFAIALSSHGEAQAKVRKKSARAIKGKIFTSNKRFSKRLSRARVKKQTTRNFWEDKEKKQWTIHFAAFFKRPLNDLEVTINLYDTTEQPHVLVATFEQYLMTRGARSLVSKIVMKRKRFGVNRRILMTIEDYAGRVLAEGTFRIGGKVVKRPRVRKVVFTEEEAR